MNISTEFEKFQTYQDLLPIAQKAVVNLSFWGSRYLTISTYDGALELDAIAQRVKEFVKKNPDFDKNERIIGQKICQQIDRIYNEIDDMVDRSNFITWVLAKIRDLHFSNLKHVPSYLCSQTRWEWKDIQQYENCSFLYQCYDEAYSYSKVFTEYYTEAQYFAEFNEAPNSDNSWFLGGRYRYKRSE